MLKKDLFRKGFVCATLFVLVTISVMPLSGSLSMERISIDKQIQKTNLGNDTTPPFTTYSINRTAHNGVYNTSIKVTLNATDNGSGVNVTYYDAPGSGGLKEYKEPFIIAMTGIFNFVYYSVDNAGNKEEVRFSPTLEMDLVPPELLGICPEKFIGPMGMKLTADCRDPFGSGCDYVEFYDDGELMFTDYEDPYEWNWTAATKGKHTLRAVVYDRAGHSDYCEIKKKPPFPGIKYVGLISNPQISAGKVSFFAILTFSSWDFEFGWGYTTLRTITFSSYYEGYIGKHFVAAKFWGREF